MPRIRTIKPEFWSHPGLSKLSDATRLLAIALLNFADDAGYFIFDANVVRGFARPFDDNSTNVRRSLDELAKIGYISVADSEEFGAVGKIEKFKEHQRIDRPSPSKLAGYYSTSVRRSFDEVSTNARCGKGRERKGKEINKEKSKENFTPPVELEVVQYFSENGYTEDSAKRAFSYYNEAGWKDSKGNKVLNWKQKMISVWFKPENKKPEPKKPQMVY